MAPEQARGKVVDKRADIWAFGVVLHEMLSGRRLFAGDEVSDVLAAVLRQDIDWSSLPSDTPPRLRRLLERCLDRDVKTRLRDIGEARVELAKIASGASDNASVVVAVTPGSVRWRERLPWTVAAAAALIAVAALLFIWMRPSSAAVAVAPLVRLPFVAPADANLTEIASVIVSPDGRTLLFSARSPNGQRQLWLRPLDSMDLTPLPDTDDAIEPFWSPDSASVAFGAHGKLKRLDLGDSRARPIIDAARSNNGTWNRDGIIVFSPDYRSPLFKVKATGGERTITTPAGGDHRYPQFLPDGRHFLFSAGRVGSIDAPEMNTSVLLQGSSGGAIYAAPGVLLYIRNGTVVAHQFDMDRLELTGQPIPIAAASNEPWAIERLSASDNGVLVVQSPLYYDYQLAWFDRAGNANGLLGQTRPHATGSEMPRASPDGRYVVVQRGETKDVVAGRDFWIGDLARGTFDRLITDEPFQQLPVWSNDGRSIICATGREAAAGIYAVPVAGGKKTLLLAGTVFPADVSPDGKWLFYTRRGEATRNDIWMLPLANGKAAGEPHVIINSPYEDGEPRVSPNGRWLAYMSDQSGINEIYVRSLLPDGRVGDPKRVSNGGGLRPVWARDGRELYYVAPIAGDRRMQFTALPVRTEGATFEFGAPMLRMKVSIPNPGNLGGSDYDVTPDGRFLVGTAMPDARTPPATIILNWTQALKR
jgi:Tol biopolymer transport system component